MGSRRPVLRVGIALFWVWGWVSSPIPTAAQQTMTLAGSGSSLAGPLLGVWGRKFHDEHPSLQVGYILTSSLEGMQEVRRMAGDLAIGEIPLSETQRSGAVLPLVQVPVAVFSIVPIYKLPVRTQIRFSGDLLAQIYMGRVTNWRDQRIARLNPEAVLPDIPGRPCHTCFAGGKRK